MESTHYRDAMIVLKIAAEPADGNSGVEQVLRGNRAERADELGAHQFQLAIQKSPAVGCFIGQWLAILGGSAFHDIADVDFFAFHPTGGNNPVEKLPGIPDKRLAAPVLFLAGRFADEAQLNVDRTDAENRPATITHQFRTAAAARDALGENFQLLTAIIGAERSRRASSIK